MTNLRTAAQQALEALERGMFKGELIAMREQAITTLKAALAEPVQEPVAEVVEDEFSRQVVGIGQWLKLPNGTKLYTTQRS